MDTDDRPVAVDAAFIITLVLRIVVIMDRWLSIVGFCWVVFLVAKSSSMCN
jgi:hypothetical protein